MPSQPIEAVITPTVSTVQVTAAIGGAGQALTSTPSSSISLANNDPANQPVQYKVGSDVWTTLAAGQGVSLAVDLSATAVMLRKFSTTSAAIPIAITVNVLTQTQPVGGVPVSAAGGAATALRQSATRCLVPQSGNGSITSADSGMVFIARGNIVNPVMEFPNWRLNSGTELSYGAATLECSVEYPIGATPVRSDQCIAAGNTAVAMPMGNLLQTFSITIPDGAVFRVRTYMNGASGLCWAGLLGGTRGEFGQAANFNGGPAEWNDLGTTPRTNRVMGGTTTAYDTAYGPIVIASQTSRPAVAIVGDSRECGGNEGITDVSYDVGPTARAIGRAMGYSSFAQSATLLSNWNAGTHTYFNQLLAKGYWTHVVNAYGVNDLGNGDTPAGLATKRATFATNIKAQLATAKVIGHTIYPYVSSSDLFITKANQTIGVNQNRVNPFNSLVRASIAGEDAYWDFADGIDPFREGKYAVGPDPSAASRTPAIVTGAISGAVLTVSAVTQGSLQVGDTIVDASGGTVVGNVVPNTTILSFGTGTGGTGTYNVSRNYSGVSPFPAAVASTTLTNACWDTRDGLHAQFKAVERALRTAGPVLLGMIR